MQFVYREKMRAFHFFGVKCWHSPSKTCVLCPCCRFQLRFVHVTSVPATLEQVELLKVLFFSTSVTFVTKEIQKYVVEGHSKFLTFSTNNLFFKDTCNVLRTAGKMEWAFKARTVFVSLAYNLLLFYELNFYNFKNVKHHFSPEWRLLALNVFKEWLL